MSSCFLNIAASPENKIMIYAQLLLPMLYLYRVEIVRDRLVALYVLDGFRELFSSLEVDQFFFLLVEVWKFLVDSL